MGILGFFGLYHHELNEFDEALRYFKKAKELAPERRKKDIGGRIESLRVQRALRRK